MGVYSLQSKKGGLGGVGGLGGEGVCVCVWGGGIRHKLRGSREPLPNGYSVAAVSCNYMTSW